MKAKRIVCVLTAVCFMLLSACAEQSIPENDWGGNPDEIYETNIGKQEFIVFRSEKSVYSIGDECKEVLGDDTLLSVLKEGEFAEVTAKVSVINGGIAGFEDNYSIDRLISYDVINLDKATEKCDIPEFKTATLNYNNRLAVYNNNDKHFLIFYDMKNYIIYEGSSRIAVYQKSSETVDVPSFIDNIA